MNNTIASFLLVVIALGIIGYIIHCAEAERDCFHCNDFCRCIHETKEKENG